MTTKRGDNDAERFTRIEALMEEYRVKHEDLLDYVQHVEHLASERRAESRFRIREARERFTRSHVRNHH